MYIVEPDLLHDVSNVAAGAIRLHPWNGMTRADAASSLNTLHLFGLESGVLFLLGLGD